MAAYGVNENSLRKIRGRALFNLRREKLLPEEFAVIGVSRESLDEETFRRNLETSLCDFGMCNAADSDWRWLSSHISYMQGEFNDPLAYQKLAQLLAKTDELRHTGGNYLFYLATPPQVFATIVQHLGESGLVREEDGLWRRVIIEKPLCHCEPTRRAAELNELRMLKRDSYLQQRAIRERRQFLPFGNDVEDRSEFVPHHIINALPHR